MRAVEHRHQDRQHLVRPQQQHLLHRSQARLAQLLVSEGVAELVFFNIIYITIFINVIAVIISSAFHHHLHHHHYHLVRERVAEGE